MVGADYRDTPNGRAAVAHSADLTLALRPSRRLGWLLGLAHAGAGLLCWTIPMRWWLSLALSMAVAASLVVTLRMHALRSAARAAVGLELHGEGLARVELRNGRRRDLVVDQSSFVSTAMTVLNLRAPRSFRIRSEIVICDTLSPEQFRRLRVWLRWRCRSPVASRADAGDDQ
jgi:toxin CptA